MCGRFFLDADFEDVMRHYFGEPRIAKTDAKNLTYETGEFFPSTDIPVIHRGKEVKRAIHMMKWGFEPAFLKKLIINARSETLEQKPMFKDAFVRRRCLVPASGYYEWHNQKKHAIRVKDKRIISLAGLYDRFLDKDGNAFWAVTLLTKDANESISAVHDRMPVIIDKASESMWLSKEYPLNALKGVIDSASPQLEYESVHENMNEEQLTLI